MRVVLFGASGMVGAGVLLECLADPRVQTVVVVARRSSGVQHQKVREVYSAIGPLYPVLRRLFPKYVTTTENMGRAMIQAAAVGYPKRILESDDINRLAARLA